MMSLICSRIQRLERESIKCLLESYVVPSFHYCVYLGRFLRDDDENSFLLCREMKLVF